MAEFGFIKVNVQGIAGPGVISATGLKAGDRLLLGYSPNNAFLEQIITVDDEIQFSESFNWSGQPPFDVIYLRGI